MVIIELEPRALNLSGRRGGDGRRRSSVARSERETKTTASVRMTT